MLELLVHKRKVFGKKLKNLRQNGWLPAIVYGKSLSASLPLQLKYSDFETVYKITGENTLLDINDDEQKRRVLIYDVTKDFVSGRFLHVDFYQVNLDERIKVKVPLTFSGESEAVKNLGGILVKNIYEVEVEALPNDLPKEIIVNISQLKNLEDSIKVQDLLLPPAVKILENPKETIVLISVAKSEEEVLEAVVSEKEKIESIKVETEEKKSARGGEKEKELSTKDEI